MLEQKFKNRRKSDNKSYLIYNKKPTLPLKRLNIREQYFHADTSICSLTLFRSIGEFIAVGKKQDMVHETADSTLVTVGRVEITY